MQFEVFTLLPEVFPPYLESSILQRARQRGLVSVNVHNIRDYTHDKHHMTDDTPYGGGGGMVMKPEPVFEAVETVLGLDPHQIQSRNGACLNCSHHSADSTGTGFLPSRSRRVIPSRENRPAVWPLRGDG